MLQAAVVAVATLVVASSCTDEPFIVDYRGPTADWPAYGGAVGGGGYSALTQIDRTNVAHLEVAWEHRHGDVSDGKGEVGRTSFQAHPIVAGGRLYYCTPFNRVFALDPESGRELWRFDPRLRLKGGEGPYPLTCRGVTYWRDETAADGAATGEPCDGFGTDGRVNLRDGLGDYPAWESYPTSPPVVVRDVG